MIPSALKGLNFVERFYSYPTLASTNDTARSITEFPQKGLFVIQADRQTGGRGRNNAEYFSDNPGGLWVSIIAPVASIEQHFAYNRALSLALCESIETVCGIQDVCAIKWPNDVYWHDRKICGILLENHPGNPGALVLGFGCNISIVSDEFPETLRPIATSIQIETGRHFPRSLVLENIIDRFHSNCGNDPVDLHRSYVSRLYGLRRAVEIEGLRGIYEGVETDGRLMLRAGRELIYILSGHLQFITKENSDFDKQ